MVDLVPMVDPIPMADPIPMMDSTIVYPWWTPYP